MSMSERKHVSEGLRRFDVFTGGGRRRNFTAAEKAAIVEESYAGVDSVCGVARRHGLTPQQLFGWRRLARTEPFCPAEPPLFVPVVVSLQPEASASGDATAGPKPRKRRRRSDGMRSSAPPSASEFSIHGRGTLDRRAEVAIDEVFARASTHP